MKTKSITFMILMLCVFFFGVISTSRSVTLISKEEALKQMFPDVDQITTENINLNASEVTKIKSRLGGQLVHFQNGSESKKVAENTTLTLYTGIKNGKKIRVAMIDDQPGKWGPVEFILALSTNPGKIENLAVISYQEKRGRPIARNNFLQQFVNKGSKDPIMLNKDIRAISGATISSDATCFAVKKAIVIFEEVILPHIQGVAQKN